ncbi:hypothetical protein Tco_0550110, partial [Tanacetum coccineum]
KVKDHKRRHDSDDDEDDDDNEGPSAGSVGTRLILPLQNTKPESKKRERERLV